MYSFDFLQLINYSHILSPITCLNLIHTPKACTLLDKTQCLSEIKKHYGKSKREEGEKRGSKKEGGRERSNWHHTVRPSTMITASSHRVLSNTRAKMFNNKHIRIHLGNKTVPILTTTSKKPFTT